MSNGAQGYEPEVLEHLHQVELEILEGIAAVCAANGITWFLDGGTALGAARHQGFIPWDDDMDIGMPRSDYDRFCELAPSELPRTLRLDTPQNTPQMAGHFAKVCHRDSVFATAETIDAGYDQGIFVDIFAYDRVFDDAEQRAKQYADAKTAVRKKYLWFSGNINVPDKGLKGAAEKLACRVAHRAVRAGSSVEKLNDDFLAAALAANPDGAPLEPEHLCTELAYPYLEPVRYDDIVPVATASFEGREYPVPRNIDTYLTAMYGDWRTLPPEEDRRNHKPQRLSFPKM